VIAHKTEQCGLGFSLPLKKLHVIPKG